MGTRGAFGYRIDGVDKITYNPCDSYPGGLGGNVAADLSDVLRDGRWDELVTKVRALELVDEDAPVSAEQRAQFAYLTSSNVGDGQSWYNVLRKAQPSEGGIWPMLDVGVMIDSYTFLANSLFCEWAYVVDLDDHVLEIYKGFVDKSADRTHLGRYVEGLAIAEDAEYMPVGLLLTVPLTVEALDAFVANAEEACHAALQAHPRLRDVWSDYIDDDETVDEAAS